jgi:hypothetical protein
MCYNHRIITLNLILHKKFTFYKKKCITAFLKFNFNTSLMYVCVCVGGGEAALLISVPVNIWNQLQKISKQFSILCANRKHQTFPAVLIFCSQLGSKNKQSYLIWMEMQYDVTEIYICK